MPKRINLAIMLFMACLLSYMMRVNLSINIIAMVEDTSSHENGTEVEALPDVSLINGNQDTKDYPLSVLSNPFCFLAYPT